MGGDIMIADTIKNLRQQSGLTQSDLAKRLNITRSSVNAWEMGISSPSSQYIIALASIFNVSTDYLLGVSTSATVSVKDIEETIAKALEQFFADQKNNNETEE